MRRLLLLLVCLGLALPTAAGAGPAGWLLAAERRTGRAALCLPVEQVRRLSLIVQHSYDQRPVAESFIIQRGRLVPTEVVFDTDTYDLRRSRYPGARVESDGGLVTITVTHPRPADKLPAIQGRVAHGAPQVLVVETTRGRRHLSLDCLGPGGTPYFIGVRPGPRLAGGDQ
ncbi:MAG: hypothetical protein C4525_13880 [Desulfarculus sp.]|nr:MAG: hypothetical protein C4525_13880 [Desulfarculus sp.]